MIASRRNCSINGAALERALELEKKLPAEGPTFVKGMMHSQVVKGFWLVSLDLLGVLMFVQCQRIRFFMLMRFSFPFSNRRLTSVFLSQGIPATFCRDHLPKHDDIIKLEDDKGKTYETNYIAYKMGLSGGWQGFVKKQHLKVGDAVVFQLVGETTFKVSSSIVDSFKKMECTVGSLTFHS
jgi:hypothetical protein